MQKPAPHVSSGDSLSGGSQENIRSKPLADSNEEFVQIEPVSTPESTVLAKLMFLVLDFPQIPLDTKIQVMKNYLRMKKKSFNSKSEYLRWHRDIGLSFALLDRLNGPYSPLAASVQSLLELRCHS